MAFAYKYSQTEKSHDGILKIHGFLWRCFENVIFCVLNNRYAQENKSQLNTLYRHMVVVQETEIIIESFIFKLSNTLF